MAKRTWEWIYLDGLAIYVKLAFYFKSQDGNSVTMQYIIRIKIRYNVKGNNKLSVVHNTWIPDCVFYLYKLPFKLTPTKVES